jgi:hypothetical protein
MTNPTVGSCRRCGGGLRPSLQFCTECGLAVASRPAPMPTRPPPRSPSPTRSPSPSLPPVSSSSSHSRSGRGRKGPVAIGAGLLVLAGLAAGAVALAHPFGHRTSPRSFAASLPYATAPRSVVSPSPSPLSGSQSPSPLSGSPSSPSSSEQQAAESLAPLLAQSGSDRQAVNAAYNDVLQCGPTLTADAQAFQSAASSHQQLLTELGQLSDLSALPQGMVGDLESAWRASRTADNDFAAWAQDQVTNGCSANNQSDPNFTAADAPDLTATASKTAFVSLWNPLAQNYGLPQYTQSDL